jgi:hypothetical protein
MGAMPPSGMGDEAYKILLSPGPIRDEVEALMQQCRKEVEDLLRRKAHTLEVLRDYLMVEEEITGDRFEQIMEALGESREGETNALRRPPASLAPHRPKAPSPVAAGNGHGNGSQPAESPVAGPDAAGGIEGNGSAGPEGPGPNGSGGSAP